MILNYKYGLFGPLDWDDICEREISLQTDLWNKLVEIELGYRAGTERTLRQDAGYRKLAEEIEVVSGEIEDAIHERSEQRRAARSKIATPGLDDAINGLAERRRALWAAVKAPRSAAFKARPEEFKQLSDQRYAAITEARQNSGLWWGNYNAVIASFDGTLRRLRPGQTPRPIEGERVSGRLTVQIQRGCPAPVFLIGGRLEAGIALDDAQWVRRGSANWKPRRAVLTATVRAEGRGTRKTASWPMIMHRPLPEGAIIKSLTITRRRPVPSSTRWQWDAVLAVALPDPETSQLPLACGIDLGWRKVVDGLRVATIADERDVVDHVILPAVMLDRRAMISELMGDAVVRMREADTAPSEDADWRHMTQEIAHWNRRRREIYRIAAAQLVARCGLIGLDAQGIAMMAMDRKMPPETRRMRTWAAPHEFAASVRDAARRAGVVIREVTGASTTVCHKCGHQNAVSDTDRINLVWRCQGCNAFWDQDENAAKNCLAAALDVSANEAVSIAGEAVRRKPPRLTRKRAKTDSQPSGSQPGHQPCVMTKP